MPSQKYLTKRKNTWFINYPVPKHLVPVIGKKYIGKTTGSSDLKEAIAFRNQFIADLELTYSYGRGQNQSVYERYLAFKDEFLGEDQDTLSLRAELLADKLDAKYKANEIPSDDPQILELQAVRSLQEIEMAQFPTPSITLNDGLKEVIKDRGLEDTRYRYESAVKKFLAFLNRDDVFMSLIKRRRVRQFIDASLETYAKGTVSGQITCLGEIWRHLVDLEYLEGDNPFSNHRIRGDAPASYVHWETKELLQVLDLIKKPEDRLPVLIGYYSGMRLGEIWGLRKQDIKEEDGITFFSVVPTEERKLKTKNSIRRIPVHSCLNPPLQAHLMNSNDEVLFTHRPNHDSYGKFFGRTKAKLIDDGTKTFHSLRDTAATHLERGGNLESISTWIMGHTRGVSLSYGLYSSGPSLSQLQRAIETIPELKY